MQVTDWYERLQELVSIRLIDTHDHILSALDRALSAYATQQFQRSGIELVLGCRVRPLFSQVLQVLGG